VNNKKERNRERERDRGCDSIDKKPNPTSLPPFKSELILTHFDDIMLRDA